MNKKQENGWQAIASANSEFANSLNRWKTLVKPMTTNADAHTVKLEENIVGALVSYPELIAKVLP